MNNIPVCKSVYTSTLGINGNRITYLFKFKSKDGVTSPDRRGRKIPSNKIDPLTEERVVQFLTIFPKYKSHYSQTSSKIYFNPSLNFDKLYSLYKKSNSANENGEKDYKSVSKTYFRRKVKEYNVSFYVPKTDSCNKCEKFKILLDTDLSAHERSLVEENRKEHWERAESARVKLREIKSIASEEASNILAFTFDLQKTQPIPYLKVNEAYYKRQLWLYNLGIHNLNDKSSTMTIWTEADGKRGSCEVGSAVYDFVINQDLTKYRKIHSFSDGCGGQNKNRNIVSLMLHVVNTTPINEWTRTYLESGHSFLPNDTDFGNILEILYPDGLPITKTKYDDTMSLMYYFAPVY